MERIYCDEICKPKTEEAKNILLELYFAHEKAKKYLSEDGYKAFTIDLNNQVRENLKLPNKLFTIAKSEDNTLVQIVLFPKEPDGNYYKTVYDEELKTVYILVDHIKE